MIRVALLALALSGCAVIEHVQILPTVNPMTYEVSCCVAYVEVDKATSGSLEVEKGAKDIKVSAKVRHSF
jgi:hypothetical protein